MRDINRDIGDMYARKADHEAELGRIMREEARERAKDAELDALRQRVAELEAALNDIRDVLAKGQSGLNDDLVQYMRDTATDALSKP